MNIEVYIDGSCRVHTTKKGSWGFIIVKPPDNPEETSGKILYEETSTVENTTISLMEMVALKESLLYLVDHHIDDQITIYSDSQFVVDSYNEYLIKWINNNWKSPSSGKDISHKELWIEIEEISRYVPFRLLWIKGHDKNKYNNYIDSLVQLFSQSGELS